MRPFRAADFDEAAAFVGSEHAGGDPHAMAGADGSEVVTFYEECRQRGDLLYLVVADRTSDRYIGECSIAVGDDRVAEIGCGIVVAARGRKVATEALRRLSSWAFSELDVARLQVFVDPANTAALRLVHAAGFTREGVLRSYWDHESGRRDAVLLARLPDDAIDHEGDTDDE